MEQEVDTLLRKEAIEVVPQLVLCSSKEGWRVASHFRSASVEPLSQQTGVQDAYTQADRETNPYGQKGRSRLF